MAKTLEALLRLQSIENQLTTVRRRLKSRQNAVNTQQRKIEQLHEDQNQLHDDSMNRRKEADGLELDLKSREEQVLKLRGVLNGAKTNKEYSALLTQINTLKADNAKLEEQALKIMQDVDGLKVDAKKITAQIDSEQRRLEEVQASTADEIARLEGMVAELMAKRGVATEDVAPELLASFERIGSNYDGEAMAQIEVHGRKPPYDYVCGGCFMNLRAEHANALQTRDEVRYCDSCGRILYLEAQAKGTAAT